MTISIVNFTAEPVSGDAPLTVQFTSVVTELCCEQNVQEYAMNQLSLGDWQTVSSKCLESSWPQYFYVNNGWPLKTINMWPIPSQNYGVRIYLKEPLSEYTDLDTEVDLPYGYDWMIIHQVALALCADFKIQPSKQLVETAIDSMAVIQRSNETFEYQYADPAFNQGTRGKSKAQSNSNYGRTLGK
jgi:hypothetical protein